MFTRLRAGRLLGGPFVLWRDNQTKLFIRLLVYLSVSNATIRTDPGS